MNYHCDHCGKSTDESSLEAWPCKLGTCMYYNWPDGSTGRHRPAPACWYCWKILLKIYGAKSVHEISFVSGSDLTEEKAINRAKVGLFYLTKLHFAMEAEIVKVIKVGPFETIQDAAKEKEISLV